MGGAAVYFRVGQLAEGKLETLAGKSYTVTAVFEAVDKVTQTLAGIERGLSGFGSAVQKAGNVALAGLGAVVGAAGAAGAAIFKLATDAAPLANVEAAFDGIAAASGKSGDEVLAAMEKGSAGMISQRDLMLSYNKASQLVSKDFANQLPDAMQYLNKVASATGQDVGFLMDSLVVGVGRLSPAILDNLAIQVSLEEATARAAKMFGVEADSLTKAQQQAGMMAVVTEKLAANTAAMPEVAGTAAAQLAEFGAQVQNAKDQVGLAFVPALQAALPIVLMLFGKLTSVIPALQRFGNVLAAFFEYIQRGGSVLNAFRGALILLGVPPEIIATFDTIVAKLGELGLWIQQVIAWAAPYVAMIAGWLSEHVKLQDVLAALGVAIGSVVIPAIAGIITAAAPVIGAFAALIAIVALLRTAWEENWGGIQQKAAVVAAWLSANVPLALAAISNFWTSTLQPALATLVQWLSTNVPVAIQALSDFWTNTLLPAITAAWDFINANLLPLLAALADLLSASVGVAVTALAGLWENVLLPALKSAGGWIKDTFGPILTDFQTWLGSVTGGVDGVASAFQNAIQWVKDTADAIRNLTLPDWLTPGSPTPFEIGLRGIGSAARQLARSEFPQLGGALAEFPARSPMGGAGGQAVDNRQTIEQINVYGAQDDTALVERLAWKLRRQRAFGGA